MSTLSAYLLDFMMTVANGAPSVTMLVSPPLPSVSNLSTTITELTTYISTNGINLSNLSLIQSSVASIITQAKTVLPTSSTTTALYTNLSASTSDATSLTTYLNQLSSLVSSSTSSSTFVSPEEDTGTATGATPSAPVRNKMGTTNVTTTKFKGLGTKVSGLQSQTITNATTNNKFITTVKGAFNEIFEPRRPGQRGQRGNSLVITNRNGVVEANPNFFNNMFRGLLNAGSTYYPGGGRGYYPNRNRNGNRNFPNRNNVDTTNEEDVDSDDTTTSTNDSNVNSRSSRNHHHHHNGNHHHHHHHKDYIKELREFSMTNATIDNTVTLSETVVADSYEISTSVNGSNLQVMFAYFTAGSASSTFACTYSLTPLSLISLSLSAFKSVTKLSSIEQSKLASQAGYTTSYNPSSLDMWTAYLIWMLSFTSFSVASYLGADIIPHTGSVTGSANYMLNQNYVNNISNISLPLKSSTMDTATGTLISAGIAGRWSDLMYTDSSESANAKTSYGSSRAIATSIMNMISAQTSTTATPVPLTT